jgi:hypothetical protein
LNCWWGWKWGWGVRALHSLRFKDRVIVVASSHIEH